MRMAIAKDWGTFAWLLRDAGPELLALELLNEPVTRLQHGRYGWGGENQWGQLNRWYTECIGCIRNKGINCPILVTGDFYSQHWDGLELPDDDQLILSAHHYASAALDPNCQHTAVEILAEIDGLQVWQDISRPILFTEFGAMHLPNKEPTDAQLDAVRMQAGIFESRHCGWFYWSYKDCMGLLRPLEWEKRFEQLTKTRLMLSADNLGSSITPPGFIGEVRRQLDVLKKHKYVGEVNIPYWNNLVLDGMSAVLEKHMRRAAWEGCVHAWGDIIERNPDLVELWKLDNCKPNERLLEALIW